MAFEEICDIDISKVDLGCLPWKENPKCPGVHAMLQSWPEAANLKSVVAEMRSLFMNLEEKFAWLSLVTPGQTLPLHKDEYGPIRLHLPLLTNPDALFQIEDEKHHMELGKLYKIRATELHGVENNGGTNRIHLIMGLA